MKARKSTILMTLVVITILPLFTGCFGVGEDDPFISFRTRKNRITGDWTVAEHKKHVKIEQTDSATLEIDLNVQNESWLETTGIYSSEDDPYEKEGVVIKNTISFEKTGKFNMDYEYEVVEEEEDEDSGEITRTTTEYTESLKGQWDFQKGIPEEAKSKEYLALIIEDATYKLSISTLVISDDDEVQPIPTSEINTETYSYAIGEHIISWKLDMLTNKEVHMSQDIDNIEVISYNTGEKPIKKVEKGEQSKILKRQ